MLICKARSQMILTKTLRKSPSVTQTAISTQIQNLARSGGDAEGGVADHAQGHAVAVDRVHLLVPDHAADQEVHRGRAAVPGHHAVAALAVPCHGGQRRAAQPAEVLVEAPPAAQHRGVPRQDAAQPVAAAPGAAFPVAVAAHDVQRQDVPHRAGHPGEGGIAVPPVGVRQQDARLRVAQAAGADTAAVLLQEDQPHGRGQHGGLIQGGQVAEVGIVVALPVEQRHVGLPAEGGTDVQAAVVQFQDAALHVAVVTEDHAAQHVMQPVAARPVGADIAGRVVPPATQHAEAPRAEVDIAVPAGQHAMHLHGGGRQDVGVTEVHVARQDIQPVVAQLVGEGIGVPVEPPAMRPIAVGRPAEGGIEGALHAQHTVVAQWPHIGSMVGQDGELHFILHISKRVRLAQLTTQQV